MAQTRSTALVTGASSGIGADIARDLARRGWHVVLVARRRDRLAALAAELEAAYGVRCEVLDADLTDRAQAAGLVDRAAAWAKGQGSVLTALVNNAGSGVWDLFADVPCETALRDIELNALALTALTHAFVTQARQHGAPSHVLNIASLAAMLPAARFAVYSGTKAYVVTFSEVLAYELRDTNVRITCSCPGGVKTEFLELAGQDLKKDIGMMDSPTVARLSVDAMLRGDVVYVPGVMNKVSAIVRFLPSALKLRIVEKSMRMAVDPK